MKRRELVACATLALVAMAAAVTPTAKASNEDPREDNPPPTDTHPIGLDIDVAGELAERHDIPREHAEDALADSAPLIDFIAEHERDPNFGAVWVT